MLRVYPFMLRGYTFMLRVYTFMLLGYTFMLRVCTFMLRGYTFFLEVVFVIECSKGPGGYSGYFFGSSLSESYFLGQPIIQLLFCVHKMPNYFLGPEFGRSLRNREKYGLHTKLDLFFTICR